MAIVENQTMAIDTQFIAGIQRKYDATKGYDNYGYATLEIYFNQPNMPMMVVSCSTCENQVTLFHKIIKELDKDLT
jgi:hypothetical protein